ncbi:MAG: hypothetical protein FD144_2309 [Rhodospirillaceae bacterium]|nr:MAG: hypothetical protein FD144_2309 [Rhodospirillaceae bacterium]
MLPACSINGMGFASSEVIEAKGARVVRTETYGVALRSEADAGITIGYSWTLALIPDCAAAPRAGKYSFGVSLEGLRPIAVVRRTGGLALDLNRRTIGVMLGFSEDALLSEISRDESINRHLILTPDEPSQIELNQTPEQSRCG